MISLQAIDKETVLLNPVKDMAVRKIPSQIRFDPLTGRSARICHFMKLKWEMPDLARLASESQANCPFCPERVEAITPCFPPQILPEGRLKRNDMILFPNLAPYDSIGAVATMAASHIAPMTAFSAERMAAAFDLAMEFFRRLEALDHPEAVYHLVNWNYMPPAGSSVIHPHLQVFATSSAPNLVRQELEASRRFKDEQGAIYWEKLVEFEAARKERYLGRVGRTHWIMSYAPMGVAGDVIAVVEDAACTLDLSSDHLLDLGRGLRRVMQAYEQTGIYSFNMNFFSGRRQDGDYYRFHLVFSPRTFFNQTLGTTDIGALRNLYNETLCMAFPEEIATMLRPYFDEDR